MIPFGEWLPDQPAHLNKGLIVAKNVYPGANGYRPVKNFAPIYNAGAAPFKGATSFTPAMGGAALLGGTATNLYKVVGSDWVSVASGFTTPTGNRWRFVQFGNIGIATNGSNPIQKFDLTTFTVSALGGTPPTARMLAVVKDFLVGGVIGGETNKLAWSGINDAEFWTYGQNQSDYQIMPSGGDINGIFGGEFGLILQRSRISRMDYVGGNEIFVINEVSSNFGCITPYSVVQHGQIGFFLSDNGFMMWDGSNLRQIGHERVDRTFFAEYARAAWPLMSAAVDTENQVVMWSMGNKAFCYNWNLDRWTTIDPFNAQVIFNGANNAVDLTQLDTAFYVINNSNVIGKLAGVNLAATLTLGDIELVNGREAKIQRVRPETDAAAGVTITVSTKATLGGGFISSNYTVSRDNGDFPARDRGRYARISMTIGGGATWTYVQGVDVDYTKGSLR